MGTAIKHPVPDRVKPSFVIFDIRALWRSVLYSCTHMATVGFKGLGWPLTSVCVCAWCVCSIRPVVCRCMELFVQHTSLVCPLSETGKLRLAADYAQLEASLSPLCHKLSELGRPYRMIRAIRSVCLSVCSVVMFLCISQFMYITAAAAAAAACDAVHVQWLLTVNWQQF